MYTFLDRVARRLGPHPSAHRRVGEGLLPRRSGGDGSAFAQQAGRRLHGRILGDVTYHGLKALGFEVTCHPEVAGTTKRPDFLVAGDECSFYVEAKVLGEDDTDRRRDKRRNDIYHELNSRVRSDDFQSGFGSTRRALGQYRFGSWLMLHKPGSTGWT